MHKLGSLCRSAVAVAAVLASGCVDTEYEDIADGYAAESITNARPLSDAPPIVEGATIQLFRNDRFSCSAVLVRPDRALTALHCVDKVPNPAAYELRFETDRAFSPRRNRGVLAIRKHPTADLATLDLDRDAPTDAGHFAALIHDPVTGRLTHGTRVVVAGFGDSGPSTNDAGTLRWGKTAFDAWVGDYSIRGYDRTFSSGLRFFRDPLGEVLDPANSLTCPGDSGGPIYQWLPGSGWRLTGINSTSHCDGFRAHAIAADVRGLKDWVYGQ